MHMHVQRASKFVVFCLTWAGLWRPALGPKMSSPRFDVAFAITLMPATCVPGFASPPDGGSGGSAALWQGRATSLQSKAVVNIATGMHDSSHFKVWEKSSRPQPLRHMRYDVQNVYVRLL